MSGNSACSRKQSVLCSSPFCRRSSTNINPTHLAGLRRLRLLPLGPLAGGCQLLVGALQSLWQVLILLNGAMAARWNLVLEICCRKLPRPRKKEKQVQCVRSKEGQLAQCFCYFCWFITVDVRHLIGDPLRTSGSSCFGGPWRNFPQFESFGGPEKIYGCAWDIPKLPISWRLSAKVLEESRPRKCCRSSEQTNCN